MTFRIRYILLFFFICHLQVLKLNAQGSIISDNPFYTTFDLIHYSVFTGPYASRFYAVELDDTQGKSWERQKVKSDSGYLFGEIALNINTPTGLYWLHAYPSIFSTPSVPQFYLPLVIINADDLDGDLWKNEIFKKPDSLQVLPVMLSNNLNDSINSRSYALIDKSNTLIPFSGTLRDLARDSSAYIHSDEKGMITISGIQGYGNGDELSISSGQGNSMRWKLPASNERIISAPHLEWTGKKDTVSLSPVTIRAFTDREIYNPRDSVHLVITIENRGGPAISDARLIIDVSEQQQAENHFNKNGIYILKDPAKKLQLSSENNGGGLIINKYLVLGKYVNPADNTPMAGHPLALVSLGENPQLLATTVNTNGYFSFDVSSLMENNSVYISTVGGPVKGLSTEFRYFRNFPDLPVLYRDSSMLASLDSFAGVAKIRNVLFYQYFESHASPPVASEKLLYDTTQVYSQADNSYNLNDYIQFADVREVIREILPYVNYKHPKNKPRIIIYNNQNTNLGDNPLFLVNGMPTQNVPFVMGLSTKDLQKIDLLYTNENIEPFGSLGTGGVMAFYTDQPIEVPGTKLLDFRGFHHPRPIFNPVVNKDLVNLSPVVYWNPACEMKNGRARADFRLNDLVTDLVVNITGYDKDGKIFRTSVVIKVRKRI